jgi:flagellar basal-body rod protein FlgB
MDLITLASRHRSWLAMRQSTVADNIANATTPFFKERTIVPFDTFIQSAIGSSKVAVSHPRHMTDEGGAGPTNVEQNDQTLAVTHSGNSVNVEDQLMTASAVKRDYALNTSISQAFRRMSMMGVR